MCTGSMGNSIDAIVPREADAIQFGQVFDGLNMIAKDQHIMMTNGILEEGIGFADKVQTEAGEPLVLRGLTVGGDRGSGMEPKRIIVATDTHDGNFFATFQFKTSTGTALQIRTGKAFIIGNTTFMTDSNLYATTDNGPFLLRMLAHLMDREAISLNIAAKPAVRPGLSASGQSMGVALMVAAPLAVLMAAVWVLVPRRNR